MITFRIDNANYGQCSREGVRIVPAVGFKVDFAEFAADSATRGLWHLHNGGNGGEGTGLEDASGGGHSLTNHGAAAGEHGYQFVRNDGDYMEASFQGEPSRSQATLEAWVQAWAMPLGTSGHIFNYRRDASAYLAIWASRSASPSASFIRATLYVQGGNYNAIWTGADADAVLASAQPWHVAAVVDAPGALRLFVNGTLRASQSAATSLPAGNWKLNLGRNPDSIAFNLSAVIDEVQLSGAARYAADFNIWRWAASGTCTSPTFDGARTGAIWSDFTYDCVLPGGTAIEWEVRLADSADAGGPLAAWQPYSGDPSALPRARYFQWRATLTAASDRITSPTLQNADALVKKTGYYVYHATGNSPDLLDLGEPWACVGPDLTQLVTEPLDAGAVHWFSIRPVDGRDVESPLAQNELRLELDGQGQPVPDRPAGVLALSACPLPGGCVRVAWGYRVGRTGILPQAFHIFGDSGSGTLNYTTPLGEVPYRASEPFYGWTSGPLAGGTHQLAVRAIAASGLWDEQPAIATVTPDGDAPGEVDNLKAEVVL